MSREFDTVTALILHATAEDLIKLGPTLAAYIPELAPMIGFDQRSPHHAYDLFTHTAHVTAAVPEEPTLRWAALLHDIGKVPTFTLDETGRGHFYGHAGASAAMASRVLRRMNAPLRLREDAVHLIENHMNRPEPGKASLRRYIDRMGETQLRRLLDLQEADMASKGVPRERDLSQFTRLRGILAELGKQRI